MASERINIEQFMAMARQFPVIDVRSPGEYKHAHMPEAFSMPLFSDEERKTIGTTYKQKSREQAIKIGLDFFGPKMNTIISEVEELVNRQRQQRGNGQSRVQKTILVYCWRGGMRSGAVSWLLDLYGFRVYTLIGGYKKFRNYVLDTFTLPFQFRILGGYTGSGKTEIIKELEKQGKAVVDLEDVAKHKGSAFGNIGLPTQPGQEMFENQLAMVLRSKVDPMNQKKGSVGITHSPYAISQSTIWIEDESQRIGLVNLPSELWATMRKSPLFFLDIPFEERLQHIAEEYGSLEKQKMIDAIGRISDKLGSLNAKTAIQFLEEGNTLESFRILLKYYDKFYLKAMHNRENLHSLLHTIECKTVTSENVRLLVTEPRYQHEKP